MVTPYAKATGTNLYCFADSDDEPPVENVEEKLATAERELLEARATYTVRKKAIETVLMTDPVLKTVHPPSSTTPVEK